MLYDDLRLMCVKVREGYAWEKAGQHVLSRLLQSGHQHRSTRWLSAACQALVCCKTAWRALREARWAVPAPVYVKVHRAPSRR